MKGHLDAARVRIRVPDASSAFRLERRLRDHHAVAVGRGPRWEVDVEVFEGDPDEIAAVVGRWLADTGLEDALVWLDGGPLRVTTHRGESIR